MTFWTKPRRICSSVALDMSMSSHATAAKRATSLDCSGGIESGENVASLKRQWTYAAIFVTSGESYRPESSHIVEAYARIREKGLSSQTHAHLHRILHTAFNYGVKTLKFLRENPVASVDPPTVDRRDAQPLSEAQVRLIVEAAKGTRLEVPVLAAALTGLRRSELLALRWSGIDFERGSLAVTGTVEHSRRYGVRFKPETKTRSSR